MTTTRPDVLQALIASAQASGQAALCELGGQHFKVVVRKGRVLVGAWVDAPRRLSDKECEEIGEDAGFYDPKFGPFSFAECRTARLIAEGYTGPLCDHECPLPAHFDGRDSFGDIAKCIKCGVLLTVTQSRRGQRQEFGYDTWNLRKHVYVAWRRRGPPPGALQPHAHHGGIQP